MGECANVRFFKWANVVLGIGLVAVTLHCNGAFAQDIATDEGAGVPECEGDLIADLPAEIEVELARWSDLDAGWFRRFFAGIGSELRRVRAVRAATEYWTEEYRAARAHLMNGYFPDGIRKLRPRKSGIEKGSLDLNSASADTNPEADRDALNSMLVDIMTKMRQQFDLRQSPSEAGLPATFEEKLAEQRYEAQLPQRGQIYAQIHAELDPLLIGRTMLPTIDEHPSAGGYTQQTYQVRRWFEDGETRADKLVGIISYDLVGDGRTMWIKEFDRKVVLNPNLARLLLAAVLKEHPEVAKIEIEVDGLDSNQLGASLRSGLSSTEAVKGVSFYPILNAMGFGKFLPDESSSEEYGEYWLTFARTEILAQSP